MIRTHNAKTMSTPTKAAEIREALGEVCGDGIQLTNESFRWKVRTHLWPRMKKPATKPTVVGPGLR